jgi:hypothetical protein
MGVTVYHNETVAASKDEIEDEINPFNAEFSKLKADIVNQKYSDQISEESKETEENKKLVIEYFESKFPAEMSQYSTKIKNKLVDQLLEHINLLIAMEKSRKRNININAKRDFSRAVFNRPKDQYKEPINFARYLNSNEIYVYSKELVENQLEVFDNFEQIYRKILNFFIFLFFLFIIFFILNFFIFFIYNFFIIFLFFLFIIFFILNFFIFFIYNFFIIFLFFLFIIFL